VITLVGGTMFLMWLGEQITAARHRQRHLADHLRGHHRRNARGAGAVLRVRPLRRAQPGAVIIGVIVMVIATLFFVVFMERSCARSTSSIRAARSG
jgi:preprotein translocase subunit SecY